MNHSKSNSKLPALLSLYSSKLPKKTEALDEKAYGYWEDASEVDHTGQASPSELTSQSSYSRTSSDTLSKFKSVSSLPLISSQHSMTSTSSSPSSYTFLDRPSSVQSSEGRGIASRSPFTPVPSSAWADNREISPLSALDVRQRAREQLANDAFAEEALASIGDLKSNSPIPPILFQSSNKRIQSLLLPMIESNPNPTLSLTHQALKQQRRHARRAIVTLEQGLPSPRAFLDKSVLGIKQTDIELLDIDDEFPKISSKRSV